MVKLLRRLFGGRRAPDPEVFLDDLRSARRGDYARIDRYRDFQAVFSGDSTAEQGRRVLWHILEWAHLYRPVAVKDDPHMTYFRDGERNIGLRIMSTMNAMPTERPVHTQRERSGER